MKTLHPAYSKSRDGQATVQIHEDERGKPPPAGGILSAVVPGLSYLLSNHSIAVDRDQRIGATLAAKVAVAEILIGMLAHDTEVKPLLQGRRQPGPRIEVRAGAISIDWPESGVDVAPPKFTIRESEAGFAREGLGLSGPDMDEETADVYGAGTVLLHRDDLVGTVIIETVLSTTSARDAIQLALWDRFATEPCDFRPGRRILLRCYYERMVRMMLAETPFAFGEDVSGERAKANEFALLCFLQVEIPEVILVPHPGRWETVPTPLRP